LNGAHVARCLRSLASTIGGREDIAPKELTEIMLLAVYGVPTRSMKLAAAGRKGGQRSALVRLEAQGSAQPKPRLEASKPSRSHAEAKPEARSKPKPEASSKPEALASVVASGVSAEPRSPLVLPSDPEDEKEESKRARSARDDRRPTCLSEALELGSMPRAELVIAMAEKDPQWVRECMQPTAWPEVQRAAAAYAKATGRAGDAKLGDYARDKGTQAVVQLLALYLPSMVYAGIPRVVAGEWFQSGKRGLSSITPEVFRRDGLEDHPPAQEARLRATQTGVRPEDVVPPPPDVKEALEELLRAPRRQAGERA